MKCLMAKITQAIIDCFLTHFKNKYYSRIRRSDYRIAMHGTHIYQTVSREQRAARERIQRSHACRAITDRPQEISNREQRAPMTANDDRGHGRSRRRAATNSYLTVIRRSRTASGRPCARGAYTSTIASTDDPGDERRRMLRNLGDREPICCSSAFSPPLTD